MIAYTEYENMMEEKDSKISDLEEEIQTLKEKLREEKEDHLYFLTEIAKVIEQYK